MALQRHLQWDCLNGAYVEIRKIGQSFRSWVVDDGMQDSSAIQDCGSFNPIILYPLP